MLNTPIKIGIKINLEIFFIEFINLEFKGVLKLFSLYDYFFPDNSINKKNQSEYSDLEQLVYKWCLDDKKRNILIKNNGEERYPEFKSYFFFNSFSSKIDKDFKLYKMITRSVTQHIPKDQLKLKIFSKYIVKKNSYLKKNKNKIMNIDLIPNHFNFKNQDQK